MKNTVFAALEREQQVERGQRITTVAAAVLGAALTVPLIPWVFIIAGTFSGVISAGVLAIPGGLLAVIATICLGAWSGAALLRLALRALGAARRERMNRS